MGGPPRDAVEEVLGAWSRVDGAAAAVSRLPAELPGPVRGRRPPCCHRGAVAVVGSSSRTYSASGGAFSLAFFDAVLYDDQSLGGSLRQAKNFLLAYSAEGRRLGEDAKRTGARCAAAPGRSRSGATRR